MPVPSGPDSGGCRPRRPGLLCNPRSGRFARQPAAFREAARAFPGGLCREGCDPREIGQALGELLGEEADIIIVLGGDGTLQAVLDHLPGHTGAAPPPLVIVPCGSTNMAALDAGCRSGPLRTLDRLRRRIEAGQELPLMTRPVLRVGRPALPPLHGMFFGAGIITAGVRYFRERVQGRGLIGEAASGFAMIRILLRLACAADSPEMAPIRARLSEDGDPAVEGSFLLLFASTLDRLLLGLRPYWGREPAPIHFTAIRDRPERLWRSLPQIARGRGQRLDERHFRSRNLSVLELAFDGDFVLDGELHAGQAGQPLRLDTAGSIRLAVP